MEPNRRRRTLRDVFLARSGKGPLLQRDYWAVLRGCALTPPQVGELLARRFCDFPPPELARFERVDADQANRPLEVGDRLDVTIRLAGKFGVCVIHRDANSVTLATLTGHPEAGRITFGAYRNAVGDVVFHIRSRARSSSGARYVGFLALGDAMQTNTWTDFIDRLSWAVGEGVAGSIHVEVKKLDVDERDEDAMEEPTYVARGE